MSGKIKIKSIPSPLSVVLIAAVIVRMVMVVVENTVRNDNVQVVGLVCMMIRPMIMPLLLVLAMLSLPFSSRLPLLRHHQVRGVMALRMFLNRSLGMLRGHHQERQLTGRKSALILLKYLLRIQDTPVLRISRLSTSHFIPLMRMVYPITRAILITVHYIHLVIIVEVYLDDLVLVKACLRLDHVVSVVVVALL